MAKSTYSFVYGSADMQNDTVWFEMETMGFVHDKDRPVAFEQLDTTATMAVPGKHYVAFDDPSMAKYYIVPAGSARTKIPVVLLRDRSLSEETVVLKFRIKENEWFKLGYKPFSERVIVFTDRLSEPSKWSYKYGYASLENYFGTYGLVKHQFLIEQTDKKWDDEYIEELMTGDSNYLLYLLRKMSKRLDEVNAERMAQGLGVLVEEDGTPVEIVDPYA